MLAAEDYMITLVDTSNPSMGDWCQFGLFPTISTNENCQEEETKGEMKN